MIILRTPIKLKLLKLRLKYSKKLIKCVTDIENRIIIVDCDIHLDGEDILGDMGSKSQYIWGFDYVVQEQELEYIAMINYKTIFGNRSEEIQDKILKDKIRLLVSDLICIFVVGFSYKLNDQSIIF
jgi:Protein of unknown function (DUF5674)